MKVSEAREIAAEYDASWRAMQAALDRFENARRAYMKLPLSFEIALPTNKEDQP